MQVCCSATPGFLLPMKLILSLLHTSINSFIWKFWEVSGTEFFQKYIFVGARRLILQIQKFILQTQLFIYLQQFLPKNEILPPVYAHHPLTCLRVTFSYFRSWKGHRIYSTEELQNKKRKNSCQPLTKMTTKNILVVFWS